MRCPDACLASRRLEAPNSSRRVKTGRSMLRAWPRVREPAPPTNIDLPGCPVPASADLGFAGTSATVAPFSGGCRARPTRRWLKQDDPSAAMRQSPAHEPKGRVGGQEDTAAGACVSAPLDYLARHSQKRPPPPFLQRGSNKRPWSAEGATGNGRLGRRRYPGPDPVAGTGNAVPASDSRRPDFRPSYDRPSRDMPWAKRTKPERVQPPWFWAKSRITKPKLERTRKAGCMVGTIARRSCVPPKARRHIR